MFNFFKKPAEKATEKATEKPVPMFKITLESVWYIDQSGNLQTVKSDDFTTYKKTCEDLTSGDYPDNEPEEVSPIDVSNLTEIGINAEKYQKANKPEQLHGALTAFSEKLNRNPSFKSRQQLAAFLNKNAIPILQNGNLLTFKAVRDDFFDYHTGKTHQYIVNTAHKMPRANVDDNSGNGCSAGLHVGGVDYVSSFGASSGKYIACEVNPEHVVSVPNHDAGKMRVCDLYVTAEYANVNDMLEAATFLLADNSGENVTYELVTDAGGKVTVSKNKVNDFLDTL